MSLKSPGVFDPDAGAEAVGRPQLGRKVVEQNLKTVWGIPRAGEAAHDHLHLEAKLLSHKIEFLGWTRIFLSLLTIFSGYLATRLSNDLAQAEWMARSATHAISVLTVLGILLVLVEAWMLHLQQLARNPRECSAPALTTPLLTALGMIIHPNFIFFGVSYWGEAVLDNPATVFARLFNDYLFVFQATLLTVLLLVLLLRSGDVGVFFGSRKSTFKPEGPSLGWLLKCQVRESPFASYFTCLLVVLFWGVLVLDVLERFTLLQMGPFFPAQATLFTTIIGTIFGAPFSRFVPQSYLGRVLIMGLSAGWWLNFGFLVVCARGYFQGAPPHPVSDKIQTNLEARGFYRKEAQTFISKFFTLKRLRSENTGAFQEFYKNDFSEARRRFREVLDDKRQHSQLPPEVLSSEVRELAGLVAQVKAKHNVW